MIAVVIIGVLVGLMLGTGLVLVTSDEDVQIGLILLGVCALSIIGLIASYDIETTQFKSNTIDEYKQIIADDFGNKRVEVELYKTEITNSDTIYIYRFKKNED